MVLGDCEGSLSLRSDESDLLIEFNTIGQNIAVYNPQVSMLHSDRWAAA